MNETYDLITRNQNKNISECLNNINKSDIDSFTDLLIKYNTNNIFTIGIGKSSTVANYISDIFKSINLKSFNLNCTNLTHGDLGCITKSDLLIVFSKSGNTKEINDIIDNINCFKILVCCNISGILIDKVNKTYIIPFNEEGDIFLKSIPSNSIINTILFFNFVVNIYIEKTKLTVDKYKINHPSGDIGFRTKKIRDFVNRDILICDNFELSNKEIIALLLKSKNGIIFQNSEKFIGILTTKDALKYFANNEDSLPIYKLINKDPIKLTNPDELIIDKIDEIRSYKLFKFIPILENGKCIGILDNSRLLLSI